jgi:hypothetical protein
MSQLLFKKDLMIDQIHPLDTSLNRLLFDKNADQPPGSLSGSISDIMNMMSLMIANQLHIQTEKYTKQTSVGEISK